MNGLLIIDKPKGLTSHDVVRKVRRRLGLRRVGHAGTLDPLATGLLLVACGEGTRIVEFLMAGEKSYRATLKLGEITDTQDAEGKVVEQRPVVGFDPAKLETLRRQLIGTSVQIPPMYSALKRNGTPLHRLARQGVEVEREARAVEIRRLEILAIELPYITLEVDCSKGTYIRTLCHDLGNALGFGAHLTSLRRIRCGSFTEAEAISLSVLETGSRQDPLPVHLTILEALRDYPRLEVDAAAVKRLRHGIPPTLAEVAGAPLADGKIALFMEGQKLLAAARFAPARLQEKRGDFELLRVFNDSPDG